MKIWIGTKILLMAMVLVVAGASPSLAHRFNVALVVPLSGAQAEQGRQFRAGFILATTERDAHANEESDGHLGGLDVYVSVVDADDDFGGQIERIISQDEVDILAAMGSPQMLADIENRLSGERLVFVTPGQPPFPAAGSTSQATFSAAFETLYGRKPSAAAARGYAAARRIDIAVREQGGVAQPDALRRSFTATATGFIWE